MCKNGLLSLAVAALLSAGFPVVAWADGNNNSAPAGAILDLAGGETGTPAKLINHGAAVTESVSFVAAVELTNITFAFREDPEFTSFSNVMLVNTASPTVNLIINGDFSSGSGENATGWIRTNQYGAQFSGIVATSPTCGGGFATCWYDGSVQAYDAITQAVATTVGDTYLLSFQYSDNSQLTTFSDLSTNGNTTDSGGNGVNIVAYAQAGLPTACTPGTICPGANETTTSVPEPASIALMGTALVALFARRQAHPIPAATPYR